MTKYLFAAAAVVVVALSGAAFAEDGKATSGAPKAMSDSEMDKVTAAGRPGDPSVGIVTAAQAQFPKFGGDRPVFNSTDGVNTATTASEERWPGAFLAAGKCTASVANCPL